MKTVQWQMQENFKFPASTGVPTGVETVKVTPRFTIDRTEASVRLTGIYHLAVNVEFDGEVNELSERIDDEDVIFIDDVDVQGETGYFEYAIPFNIDLPPEADDPLNIVTTNAVCEQNGQGALGLIWDVECSYRQVVIVQEESPEQKTAHAEAKLTAKAELEAEATSEPEKESKVVFKTEPAPESKTENEPASEQVVELEQEEEATEVLLETVSFTEKDEVLAFLMGLEDGYSASSFRSNDVPVQSES